MENQVLVYIQLQEAEPLCGYFLSSRAVSGIDILKNKQNSHTGSLCTEDHCFGEDKVWAQYAQEELEKWGGEEVILSTLPIYLACLGSEESRCIPENDWGPLQTWSGGDLIATEVLE